MSDSELRELLKSRLEGVELRIRAACARAHRERGEVALVAVTKSVGVRVARLLTEFGVLDLGESRPQELWRKAEALKDLPIRWHMIGHLQRNKIERTLPLVHRFHSGDSDRLLMALEAEAAKRGLAPRVMIEVNASREENKGGFAPEQVPELGELLRGLPHLKVDGLMTMAAYSDDPAEARATFAAVRGLSGRVPGFELKELSMGMSNDFEIGIEEGATFVRIGTTLFEGMPGD